MSCKLKHRSDIPLRQAAKFKPQTDSIPDEDGNFWITVRGKKIPFKEGEEMADKIDGIINKSETKDEEKIREKNEDKARKEKRSDSEKVKYETPISKDEISKIVDKLKTFFPATKNPKGKVFLTPDGEWIQLPDDREHLSVLPAVAEKIIGTSRGRNTDWDVYLNAGIIRGGKTPDGKTLFLQGRKPLNSKQKEAIELDLIKNGKSSDSLILDFDDKNYESKFPKTIKTGSTKQSSCSLSRCSLNTPSMLKYRRDIPLRQTRISNKQAANSQLIEVIHEYGGDVGYFLKIFFINSEVNGNIWKVARSSIPEGLKTGLHKRFFGKTAPIICMPDWDQAPKLGHPDPFVQDMVSEQEPARKGDFVAVGSSDDGKTGWVIVRIDDKETEMDHRLGKIKYVSPSIESIKESPEGEDLIWRINHLAFVTDPAYGFDAQVTGSCTGKPGECIVHLSKQASYSSNKLRYRRDISLKHRRDIPLRQATSINGKEIKSWITINGVHVPVFDGDTKEDATKRHIGKLEQKNEKPEKKDKPKKKDKPVTTYSEEMITNTSEKAEKKDIESFQGGMTKKLKGTVDTAHMEVVKKIWNGLSKSDVKGIDELVVKGSISKQRSVLAGQWIEDDKRMEVVTHPRFTPKDYAEIIHHELGHKDYRTKTEAQKAAWSEFVESIYPITVYARAHRDRAEGYSYKWVHTSNYQNDPDQKRIIDKNIKMYRDLYINETHSEVVSVIRSGKLAKSKVYSQEDLDKAIEKYKEIF